ncbi:MULTISPECIES: AMP-binding protein [Acidithrix]|uniref:Long-chain-fatty-acid--CoA ligase FadD13 n=1 Tax=Acidithrix ferrooxidans TaxID=1280514 RepID=A0A0D8HEB4_9ACTN|nr:MULTISPECIES: AMP-binding protein [Acidithrix]KJF16137.1 long-chain-fatty-acid--CoA ligase FadD13 [Acidithrix ferrooxidans]CAG4903350.1 unnamed protein product [Acidithrix sp. C25]
MDRIGIVGTRHRFDESDISRGKDGILHYMVGDNTLVELLANSAARNANKIALRELNGRSVDYSELLKLVEEVAGGLRHRGVSPGDRVGIRLSNGIDWVVSFFAIAFAGAVVVPINTRLAPAEVEFITEDSGLAYLFLPNEELPRGDSYRFSEATRETLAGILYTSGTTGRPKGAMLSNENFVSNVETVKRVVPIESHDLMSLVAVPLFHVTGLNAQMLPTIAMGGTLVLMETFDINVFIDSIETYNIDTLVAVPAIYWFALNQPSFEGVDTSSVKYVLYGGAPMPPDLVPKMMGAFPNARLGNGFGLTETSSIATFLPHEFAKEHPESVGFASPVTEVDLAEVDPVTGVGELMIRGANVAMGYWNLDLATKNSFGQGWFKSGDMARISDEGLIEIVDRRKDMVNRGGENVYCVEVENVLAEFVGVLEVAVIGVPDEMMGEKVGAVVVPVPGVDFDPAAMVAFARSRLADYKVPQYVWVKKDPLPRNAGGKVLKPNLRSDAKWGVAIF